MMGKVSCPREAWMAKRHCPQERPAPTGGGYAAAGDGLKMEWSGAIMPLHFCGFLWL